MKEMKIKILPDGSIEINDIKGVAGNECLELTVYVERELGEITKREFFQEQNNEEFIVNREYEKQN